MAEELAPIPGSEPAAPVTPPAPEPPAPPTPPAPEPPAPPEPTAEEVADQADADEWDKATEELFPGVKVKKEPKKDEPAKPPEDLKKDEAPKVDPKDQEPDAGKGAGDDAGAKDKDAGADGAGADKDKKDDGSEEEGAPDTSARDSRVAARESAAEIEAVSTDVREKMFKDEPTELQDKDGDPIKTIDDVMRLVNPRTGEAFTEEEAGQWLLAAQSEFNKNIASTNERIREIAEVNVDLKDEADAVNYRFGELLKSMPDVRAKIWSEFEKTLVKDKDTGIVTKMPVSLESFYTLALEPYVKLADGLEATKQADEANAKKDKEEADAKKAEEEKKKRRADRGDLYGGGKDDLMDDDEKEWAAAATEVFGPLNKLNK